MVIWYYLLPIAVFVRILWKFSMIFLPIHFNSSSNFWLKIIICLIVRKLLFLSSPACSIIYIWRWKRKIRSRDHMSASPLCPTDFKHIIFRAFCSVCSELHMEVGERTRVVRSVSPTDGLTLFVLLHVLSRDWLFQDQLWHPHRCRHHAWGYVCRNKITTKPKAIYTESVYICKFS